MSIPLLAAPGPLAPVESVARALIGVLALALCAACGQASEPGADRALRFGLAAGPVTLDTRFATDAASSRINRLLYGRLVEFDEALRPVPGIARWEMLSPTHYRFSLRPERRPFSDETPLTAEDVKATYEAVLDPAAGSPHRATLAGIRALEVVDEATIDFRLRAPDLLFPSKLVVGILPGRALAAGHQFNVDPIGSGDFGLVAWPQEDRLVIERRDDGQRVEFLRVPDPTTRVLKLLKGEIDMLQSDLSPELVRWLEGRAEVQVLKHPGTRFTYLGFNLEDPVAGDLRLRRAVAFALDRAAIIEHVMGGTARLASAILPPTHWAGHPGLVPIPYDLERARALVREAGYDAGRRPRLVYKTSADPFRLRLATIVQAQLEQAGFAVDVQSHDWGTFYGDIKAGRFQMFSLSWVGIKTPDIFRYVFHSTAVPPRGANRGRYASPLADRLIEQAERAETLAEKSRYYRALQAQLLEDLPYVALWYEDNFHVARAGLTGYTLDADGDYDGLRTVRAAAGAER